MNILNLFGAKKTPEKPVLKPDAMELLLDLAERVEKLEKDVIKWHLKQSPGRPPIPNVPLGQPGTQVINIGGKPYNIPTTMK